MQPGIYREQMSWEKNFTSAPNEWLRDDRISFKAKGLLLYLLSHEVGYNITFNQIERETRDGIAAIRAGIEELIQAGYLEVQQTKDENGYNAGLSYLLKNPTCENPTLENPTLENRIAYKKTTIKENKELRTNVQTAFERFWEIYPRKQGKADALKAFTTIDIDPTTIINGALKYRDDPNRLAAFTKMPGTWLRAGCWDDEPLPERVLSREEKLAQMVAENQRIKSKDIEETQRLFAEFEAAESRAKADPPKKCVHDRIAVICDICSKHR
jgi:hypothetical protein